jgi:hypothetical protein
LRRRHILPPAIQDPPVELLEASMTGKVQGEGDYESARRFDEDEKSFVAGHDVDALAKQAAPKSREEKEAMERAEQQARSRSKGEDSVDRMSSAEEDEDDEDIEDDEDDVDADDDDDDDDEE